MNILSIDTATDIASVAILKDTKLLGEINLNIKNSHSMVIMDMIIYILKTLELTLEDIYGIVVSKGPGSFTGLRIGISTAKGICHGSNKPIIGISSLDSLAFGAMYFNGKIVPILNALRENVYTCIFKNIEGSLNKLTDYMFISVYDLKNLLKDEKDILFVGDAVNTYGDILLNIFPNSTLCNNMFNYVKASNLGILGMKSFKDGQKDDIESFAPIYLKKSYAEEILEMEKK
ncbi:MAG: tRNA (adenosine(37)-N6)-threonylcarbamoyltransferase complex dimerization subunit type 1 TsaB [Oscillospiraceae bacterium]|nr:tRNA (adenosine(37)-N6)-threonylcarbamoyltransferase complex dimerization subunit type 1 TsaB [Oscillospiraceae bacterium]